jgi:hypothetical protein
MCFYVWQRYSETRNGERDKRRHAERCKYQTAGVSREKKIKEKKGKEKKMIGKWHAKAGESKGMGWER